MTDTPLLLLDATGTADPIRILINAQLVDLQKVPAPDIRRLSFEKMDAIQVCADPDGPAATIYVNSGDQTSIVFCEPPVQDGVLYLVKSSVLAKFPLRSDFVSITTYSIYDPDDTVLSEDTPEDEDPFVAFFAAQHIYTVTREPGPIRTENSERLSGI